MSQNTVLDAPLLGSPGDIADHQTARQGDLVSAFSQEAAAPIVIGTMVKRGTVERSMKELAAQADKATAHGILVRAHHYSSPTEIDLLTVGEAELDALNPGVLGTVGKSGEFVVLIEEDVDIGDAVRVRCVAGAGEVAGAFRTSADGTDCLLLPTDAFYWVKGGAVDADTGFGVAVLHVDTNAIARATADA